MLISISNNTFLPRLRKTLVVFLSLIVILVIAELSRDQYLSRLSFSKFFKLSPNYVDPRGYSFNYVMGANGTSAFSRCGYGTSQGCMCNYDRPSIFAALPLLLSLRNNPDPFFREVAEKEFQVLLWKPWLFSWSPLALLGMATPYATWLNVWTLACVLLILTLVTYRSKRRSH